MTYLQRYSVTKKEKKIKILKVSLLCIGISVLLVALGITAANIIYNIDRDVPVVSINPFELIPPKEVTLSMVGDNLLHMPLIKNGEQIDGTYNFDSLYEEMKPYFEESDISVIVQETVLGGEEFEYSGYPLFNTPQEAGDSIKKAGFDVVLHATNHTLDKGAKGIENTLQYWKNHPDITVLGINESFDKQNEIAYCEKNEIKFALLNYTDSTNGIPLPSEKEYLLNVADEEKIISDLKLAEQNADFTVVFMHWGTEYSLKENEYQKNLAAKMCEYGADLIMGSHPHVIEPVKWIDAENGNKALVFYSLGNYVSRQKEAENLLGIIGTVKIVKEQNKKPYISEATVMPTVTHYNVNSRGFKVYPLKDYTDDLASVHGVSQYDGKVSVERFRKIFESVFAESGFVNLDY